ncbi:MAG: FtsW/RodA/SpoVE family cell cycle protein [Candidatus Levyibacteriota bacterium]
MNHSLRSLSFNRLDLLLLLPAIALIFLSLITLYSIDISLFRQQLTFLVVSLVFYVLFLNLDYRIFGFFSKQMYIGILLSLGLLFIIGIEAKGAVRWIDVFGIRIQFSEIIKPFFVIILAKVLSSDEGHSLSTFLKALALTFPVFFLILRQPDLGNAIIFFLTAVCMMLAYGFPKRYFVSFFALVALPLPFFYGLLKEYQRARLFSFINSTSDPFGSSYNSIQALISIGSGGFMGKGLGQATQSVLRFLPERHTDFIFATISESLGLVGGILIITLFLLLLLRIYKISTDSLDSFSYLTTVGLFFLLLIHAFFNIGMNLGILPIVGITLPLVSYGGSSLLTNFIILSILSTISSEKQKGSIFEIN